MRSRIFVENAIADCRSPLSQEDCRDGDMNAPSDAPMMLGVFVTADFKSLATFKGKTHGYDIALPFHFHSNATAWQLHCHVHISDFVSRGHRIFRMEV